MENRPAPPSLTQQRTTGQRGAKPYGVDLPWLGLASASSDLMHHYASTAAAFPVFPFLGGFGAGPNIAMNQAKRPRAEVSFQPRPCQSFILSSGRPAPARRPAAANSSA
jgi:cyclin-dependent kinase 8/11